MQEGGGKEGGRGGGREGRREGGGEGGVKEGGWGGKKTWVEREGWREGKREHTQ